MLPSLSVIASYPVATLKDTKALELPEMKAYSKALTPVESMWRFVEIEVDRVMLHKLL